MNANALSLHNESFSVRSLDDVVQLGNILAQSGFFADSRESAQCITKILAGQEMGFAPISSMTGIHIINGKPTLSANMIASSIKRSGKYNYRVLQHDNNGCEIAFFEGGQEIGRSTFTIEDAQVSGALTGKNAHTWKAYGRNMMFARAISNGARWHCPDIFGGGGPVYMPEELGASVNGEGDVVIDVRPVPQNVNPQTGEITDALPEHGKAKAEPFDAGKARSKIKELHIYERDLVDLFPEEERSALLTAQNDELDIDLRSLSSAQLNTLGGDVRKRAKALEQAIDERGLTPVE